jgi:hypothetical protein
LKSILVFTIFFLFLFKMCFGQAVNSNILIGTWKGQRFDKVSYFRFIDDSTYNSWIDARTDDATKEAPVGCYICGSDYKKMLNADHDSSIIYHYNNLDSTYFHIIDHDHFYIILTFYATEKIIYHRVYNFKP